MMIKKIFLALIILISLNNSISASATSSYAEPVPLFQKPIQRVFINLIIQLMLI